MAAILALGAAACGQILAGGAGTDRSFLTGEPCAAPCWYGLDVDRSNEREVRDTLKSLPFIDQASLHDWTTPWHEDPAATLITWAYSYRREGGGALLANGKLKMMDMAIDYPLSFRSMTDKLGTPDFASLDAKEAPDQGCVITLAWRSKNTAGVFSDDRNSQQCDAVRQGRGVDPDLQVSALFYLVEEGFEPGLGPPGRERIPWPGFSKP